MERKQFIELISSLERKYAVNDWQINGIHIWPIIKIDVFFKWHRNLKKAAPLNNSITDESAKLNYLQVLNGIIRTTTKTVQNVRLSLHKNVEHIYCSAPHFRYDNNGTKSNRYFNQLIAALPPGKDFFFIESGQVSEMDKQQVDYPSKTIYTSEISDSLLLLSKLKGKIFSYDYKLHGLDNFLSDLKSETSVAYFSVNYVKKKFQYIDTLKSYYKFLLLRSKVKEVYILCYYKPEMYAMCLAAAECGVKTYDIQHGGQGELHIAYANFNNVPKEGYKIMPEVFWCWDNSSAEVISKWTRRQSFHTVVVKGNPWVQHCLKMDEVQPELNFHSREKIILYTLQPIGDKIIDSYILEAIKETPEGFSWWLRLHPRQIEAKERLKEIIARHDLLDKVNIEEATSLPLPVILTKSSVHISKFSGAVVEAALIGKHTIIIDPIGVENYTELIANGSATAIIDSKSKSLVDEIRRVC